MSFIEDSKPAKVVLTIAGSDCSGGAGIQADIKTGAAFGVFAASVITAITAQNSGHLYQVFVLPEAQVLAQLEAVIKGLPIAAIKLGMLGNSNVAAVVSDYLTLLRTQQPTLPIVIDPVIQSSSGGTLSNGTLDIYRQRLLPLATILTPNLSEAAQLLDVATANTLTAMEHQAKALVGMGAPAVLLKGGHFTGGSPHEQKLSTDLLATERDIYPFSSTRLDANHTHGGGCTLAMAIAAGLAQGLSLRQAIAAAKTFIQGAIAQSARLQLAAHNGPLHHFYSYW